MKVLNEISDNRINAKNVLILTTLGEYAKLAENILEANPFQRKRVKSASTVYSLLKADLQEGIVMPPIVLGLNLDLYNENYNTNQVLDLVSNHAKQLLILDGLQRTLTIREMLKGLAEKNPFLYEKVCDYPLRVEIYIGINKLGILYRMLTLNTGQTPMSSRHQIEIIYADYIDKNLDGIRLIRQIEDDKPIQLGEYNFNDVIDGFTSYIERDYLAIERADILDNIKSLEKLSIENQNKDLFSEFISTYNFFVARMIHWGGDWIYSPPGQGKVLGAPAFGKNVIEVLNKSQVMTGFGSAIGKLLDINAINNLEQVRELTTKINVSNFNRNMDQLIVNLDNLRSIAKKVGNDQRLYFHYFFRELFDYKSDSYLNLGEAIKIAYQQYERRTKL